MTEASDRDVISDATLLDTVRELYESGRRDALGGGVHPSRIADALDVSRNNIYLRLADLESAGELESVRGMNPDTGKARTSYVLPEHLENPE